MQSAILGVVFLASFGSVAHAGVTAELELAAATELASDAQPNHEAAHSSAPELAPTEPAQALARETLENGFEILALADPALQERVFGALYVRCGRVDEVAGQEGALDLLVETWLAGGSTQEDGEALAAWLAARSASLDASAADDHLSIDFQCARADLPELYQKLAACLATPRYPEPLFFDARETLATNLATPADADDDERGAYRTLERFALGPTLRAGRSATRASVRSIDRDELVFFHKAFLVPDRMLLGLSGAVDATVLDATRAFAARLPALDTRERDWSTYLEAPERTTVYVAAARDPHMWLVARAPGAGEADHALLAWALAGETPLAGEAARAAGLDGAPARRVLHDSEWLYSSLRLDSGFEPTRARDALAALAGRIAPAEFAALHARASSVRGDVALPTSARARIERELLASIRALSTKLAVAPAPADLEAAAARWFDPTKVVALATGPVDVLVDAFGAVADVRVLDATWTVASTPQALAKLDTVFAALGGRARFAALRSLSTSGNATLTSGLSLETRQVRDFVGRRLWQEQKRGETVDVTVLDESGATTFRGASAQRQPGAVHARLVRRSNAHLYQLLRDLACSDARGVRLGTDGALEVVAPDGLLCWLELDEDGRPKRLGWPADAEGDGAVFVYSDWRAFDGWWYPAAVEQPEAGVRSTTTAFTLDAPLDEALFRRTR
ncbi:MAG: hypothetical protein L6Q99_20800 [Planctomycetes bacterium]|nr:hypothetical protein [Planctomycetota bacterium]